MGGPTAGDLFQWNDTPAKLRLITLALYKQYQKLNDENPQPVSSESIVGMCLGVYRLPL